MIYQLNYHMHLQLSQPVSNHFFTLRTLPRLASGFQLIEIHQQCSAGLDSKFQQDGFDNLLIGGHHDAPHDQLTISVQATLKETQPLSAERLHPDVYRVSGRLTEAPSEALAPWLSTMNHHQSDRQHIEQIALLVHDGMQYETGSTHIEHNVRDLLQNPVGVCQDYAHLCIALLREQGFAARYVAGIMQGEGESHAWVEVWHDNQWLGIDPTHQRWLDGQHAYLPFAVGRDFADCPLNSGCFTGQATQILHVNTQLERLSIQL